MMGDEITLTAQSLSRTTVFRQATIEKALRHYKDAGLELFEARKLVERFSSQGVGLPVFPLEQHA